MTNAPSLASSQPEPLPALLDPARLGALQATGLLGTPAEEAFDRVTRLAAQLVDAPIALLALIGADRQFCKSAVGLEEPWASRRDLPLSHSLCRHVVSSNKPLVVDDVRRESLARDNPLLSALGVAAYAGVPLATEEGHVLGTLCAMDRRPRAWTLDELAALHDLAAIAMDEIALRSTLLNIDALRADAERWDLLNRGTADGIWDWDLRTNRVYISPRWKEMLGYADDEIPNRLGEWIIRVHPEDRGRASRTLQEHLAGETAAYTCEHRMRHQDGSWRWILDRGTALRDATGTAIRMIGSHTDITERKLAEEALGQSRAQYEALVDSLDGVVWEADAETLHFTFVSRQAERLLGYPIERWLESPDFWVERIHPDDRAWAVAYCKAATAEGRDHEFEYRFRAADGRYLWLRDMVTVATEDGVPRNLRGLMIDVTDRRHLESQLREREAQLQALFSNAPVGLAIVDRACRYVAINPTLAAINGHSVEAHLDRTPAEIEAVNADQLMVLLRAVLETGHASPSIQLERSQEGSSTPQHFLAFFFPIVQGGATVSAGAVVLDVTPQRSLEEQLRQSQKMEAVGRLAGGIAHDFNNILTGILSYSELILSELAAQHPLREDVEEIRRAGERAANLTRQLLAFSRRQVLQPRPVSLNAVIEGLDRMLRRLIGEDVELSTELEPNLGSVLADPGQIEQVILNLSVNARDAMPDGGTISIRTAEVSVDATESRRLMYVVPGRYVTLTVRDTGVGMDAETQGRIFEPFFTTKEQGKGTGLGLSMVYGIVKQSGGSVFVRSAVGEGSAFTVYLPRAAQAAVPEPVDAPAARPAQGGSETILLVEDDGLVRRLARQVLHRAGYKVLEASDGPDALALVAATPAPIDLLVTDVVMPRMSGRQLVAQLQATHGAQRVLFVSGYSEDAIVHHGILTPGAELLAKPFTPEALMAKVREMLDRPVRTG